MTALLDIRGLSLAFLTDRGAAQVLDRVDLVVGPGEIVGLVGESGSGKTTLARAVLGMLPPGRARIGSGHVRLGGIDMLAGGKAVDGVRGRLVTVVPQDTLASLNPLFRVGTQIADLMRWTVPRPPGGRANAVAAMLDAVQLPRTVLDRFPHQLSGGQRQRVMIAMALLPQPRLIVADEPTAALDALVQAQILGLLRRLAAERGVAVLLATHNLGAAWEICDRVAVMYAGQIAEVAPRTTFFTRPRHPYTRMLLASLPDPGRLPQGIAGSLPDPLSPPPGCRFAPRCPDASALCRGSRPPPVGAKAGHLVACHHARAIAPSFDHV